VADIISPAMRQSTVRISWNCSRKPRFAEARLAALGLDRARGGGEECLQHRQICNDDGGQRHRAATERDHPHRGGKHQPWQRTEEAKGAELRLRDGCLQRFAKGDGHAPR
jgi:hypothetical protein